MSINTDGGHARCHLETDAVLLRQAQGLGEALHGISVGPPVLPALEEADRIHTQPGPLGQVLLRQTCRISVLTKQIAKGQMLTGIHYSLSLHSAQRRSLTRGPLPVRAHDSTPPEYPGDCRYLGLSGRLYDLSVEKSGRHAHDGIQEVQD